MREVKTILWDNKENYPKIFKQKNEKMTKKITKNSIKTTKKKHLITITSTTNRKVRKQKNYKLRSCFLWLSNDQNRFRFPFTSLKLFYCLRIFYLTRSFLAVGESAVDWVTRTSRSLWAIDSQMIYGSAFQSELKSQNIFSSISHVIYSDAHKLSATHVNSRTPATSSSSTRDGDLWSA